MRSLVAALRRTAAQTETPVPMAPRWAANGYLTGWAQPAGQEAQMHAMGTVGTLYAIVGGLAEDISHVAWKLYRKATVPDAEPVEVLSHPALDLWTRPNAFMPRQEFVEVGQQQQDLVGETWWVVNRIGKLPIEMWPVRPDRMIPVPHPTKFLTGYMYRSPDGELIPLGLDQVIQMRRPNPLDIYRGMGPVQAMFAHLDAVRYSAEWNRNFFLNNAEPGGIIEVERRMEDEEFEEMKLRWNEQHRGIANAHRVAIIEQGKWVDRKFSMRDMQFSELADVNNAFIRQAYRYPKPMLGEVGDVNRANAEAMRVIYAQNCLVPRLERIKAALNNELLPMYGPGGLDVEFDYTSPVETHWERDNAERQSRVSAVGGLVGAGFDPAEALEWAGLPPMTWTAPVAVKVPVKEPSAPAVAARWPAQIIEGIITDAGWELPAWARPLALTAASSGGVDLAGVREDVDTATATLEADYQPTVDKQTDDLSAQAQAAVDDNVDEQADDGGAVAVLAALALLAVPASLLGLATLTAAVGTMATTAAKRAISEVADAGVTVAMATVQKTIDAGLDVLHAAAEATVRIVADGLAASAAKEAVRLWTPGTSGKDLGDLVSLHLTGLAGTDRLVQFGGLLHRATNAGRGATFDEAGQVKTGMKVYASEANDTNRCGPCADFDGHQFATLTEAQDTYVFGYPDCQGGIRCRGTYYVDWN